MLNKNKGVNMLKTITTKDEAKALTLKVAQKFVGGWVECVTFPNNDTLIINEEGKLKDLPLNKLATELWRKHFTKETHIFGYDDFVVGNAIVIKSDARTSGGW
jgi:hypothetical protein